MGEVWFKYYRVCRRITRYAELNMEPPGRVILESQVSKGTGGRGVIL